MVLRVFFLVLFLIFWGLGLFNSTFSILGQDLITTTLSFLWQEHFDPFNSINNILLNVLLYIIDFSNSVGTEHKYEIVKRLQARKHVCGMTGDGVNDAPALKKADIGIAVADATDAARSASDIVLTEPGLSVIISAVLTSRAIFQRMKNYTVSPTSTKYFKIWFNIKEFHKKCK